MEKAVDLVKKIVEKTTGYPVSYMTNIKGLSVSASLIRADRLAVLKRIELAFVDEFNSYDEKDREDMFPLAVFADAFEVVEKELT